MDSSAAFMHHFNLLQIHHLALQHYTPRTPLALPLDAHYRLENLKTSAYLHQLPQIYSFSHQHHLQ